MTLINKTKFLNHTDFIIRLLYKHSYYSHCIVQCFFVFFLVFTVTMRLSLFLLNEHDDDDDDEL